MGSQCVSHSFLLQTFSTNGCFPVTNVDKVHTKFLVHNSDDELDKIMGYHKLLEILEEQHQQELRNGIYWQSKHIGGHQGP